MDVSIVITCWNGRKLLEKNLPSVLEAFRNPKNQISEVIVVDDYSTDDSAEFMAKRFPQIKLFKHNKNYGYSTTCNTGVKNSTGGLVVILNNDVVPEKDFLEASLPHFKDEKVFSVSFNEGKFGPGKLSWKKGLLEIVGGGKIPQTTSETDWPNGGSSGFRKSYWEKIGGMDEIFLPFYFEDIDLGIRARKAGFKCLWEPKSKIKHEHEATINSDSFSQKYIDSIKQRNHLLLTWKNLNSFKLFFRHIFNLKLKCFFHPGFIRILLLALRRRFFDLKK